MKRYKLTIAYDGTAYCGWQRQVEPTPTVQREVEKAAGAIVSHPVTVQGSSRTDTGVHARGQEVRLTPKEFDLFVYLGRHPNRVIPHAELLEAVWGEASQEQPEYLRVFMGQLRKKLEPDPSNPRYLVTEPWVGYRFNPKG